MRCLTDLQERLEKWKKKSWLEFCKAVMQQDGRYSVEAYGDIFGSLSLRRDGTFCDVHIHPHTPQLGVYIEAGSKFAKTAMACFPSMAMVGPVLKIADELERQFVREVKIEENKHLPARSASNRGGQNEALLSNSSHSYGGSRPTAGDELPANP